MSRSTYASLMDAIQSNDSRRFRTILQRTKGLPHEGSACWLDYDLLLRALQLNRRLIVGYLLDNGGCRVWKPCDKTSPLHTVVSRANYWHGIVIERLLCLGARASARDVNGDTAVHVAFKSDAPASVLRALVRSYLHETSGSIANDEGLGVLHIACTTDKLELVKGFFRYHRASLDSQVSLTCNSSHAGYTALHFAVEYGRHEIVGYLLERGADLYRQNRNGSTPLHMALEYCDVRMVNLICYYVTQFDNIANSRGLSHFMAACASNDPSLVEKYLSAGDRKSLINNRVEDESDYPFAGYTPLHFAATYDRVHIARLLLYCHGEELFWAATARNHTAASLAFESKRYGMANLFSAYCQGGDVWMTEIENIGEESVVRQMNMSESIEDEEEEDSFSSCRDFFDFVEDATVECDACSDSYLDDTLPLDDDDVGEVSIHVTPRSTRSLYGPHDETFLTRIHHMHRMSRHFFFNVDQDEDDERSSVSSICAFLSIVRSVPFIAGTVLLLSFSVLVPVI